MQTITTPKLLDALRRREPFLLVDVLSPSQHAEAHLPRAVNIPWEEETFAGEVASHVPDKETPVIVYGAGTSDEAARQAGTSLESAGFATVYAYEGGMAAWREAGHPVASDAPATQKETS